MDWRFFFDSRQPYFLVAIGSLVLSNIPFLLYANQNAECTKKYPLRLKRSATFALGCNQPKHNLAWIPPCRAHIISINDILCSLQSYPISSAMRTLSDYFLKIFLKKQ